MDWETFFGTLVKYHKGKLFGVFLGLVFGMLTAMLGFWKAMFIAFCILVGYIIGKKIDEHKSFKSLLEKLFED